MLVGYLCAVREDAGKQQRESLYREWVGDSLPVGLAALMEESHAAVLENLDEFADFEFRLLVPEGKALIHERARSIALWCSGFLSGFGESGKRSELAGEAMKNVEEALQDIGRIAAMTDVVSQGEENEVDLAEIEEFVRVSTLLIFAETRSRGEH